LRPGALLMMANIFKRKWVILSLIVLVPLYLEKFVLNTGNEYSWDFLIVSTCLILSIFKVVSVYFSKSQQLGPLECLAAIIIWMSYSGLFGFWEDSCLVHIFTKCYLLFLFGVIPLIFLKLYKDDLLQRKMQMPKAIPILVAVALVFFHQLILEIIVFRYQLLPYKKEIFSSVNFCPGNIDYTYFLKVIPGSVAMTFFFIFFIFNILKRNYGILFGALITSFFYGAGMIDGWSLGYIVKGLDGILSGVIMCYLYVWAKNIFVPVIYLMAWNSLLFMYLFENFW
jgi:hypothetical protein